jgi:LPXTG-site transpeptidase (sortase) family protein
MLAVGVLLAGIGASLALSGPSQSAPRQATAAPRAIIQDSGFPVPSPQANVPEGTRVVIRDLGIDLPMVPGDGQNAPLYKAATYPSPLKLPGEGGRSMIYAHARTGMFGPLFQAHVGQQVEVHQANGKVLAYTIKEYYAKWSARDLRWLQPTNHEELILETCTTYNANDPRIIAVAEPN